MAKSKCQTQFKIKMSKLFLNLSFDIHLIFACLCEAASAKAGILKFGLTGRLLSSSRSPLHWLQDG